MLVADHVLKKLAAFIFSFDDGKVKHIHLM
jgi:hypothetical protein